MTAKQIERLNTQLIISNMKYSFIYIYLIIFLFFLSKSSFAQNDSYVLVWNYVGKCIFFEKGDTNTVNAIIPKINLGKDSVALMYVGIEIKNKDSFHPVDSNFCIEYDVSGHLILYSIFPHNDSLDNGHLLEDDTSAMIYNLKYRDHLPDGIWIRVVHDSSGIYKESFKSINNGYFDGAYFKWFNNGRIQFYASATDGFMNKMYCWDTDGFLTERSKYKNNILIERYSYLQNAESENCISHYYNYNWGYISFYEGNALFTGRVYKGVNHGDFFEFDSNGNIIDYKRYFYGKEIK
jgi:antitoxin component YwqK of YwqJK toxin-antitoxin module